MVRTYHLRVIVDLMALGMIFLAGCQNPSPVDLPSSPVPATSSPAAPASLSCGSIQPGIILGCHDKSPDELSYQRLDTPVEVPSGVGGVQPSLEANDCLLTNPGGDGGYTLEGRLLAKCEQVRSESDTLEQRLTLRGYVARVCGTDKYGSGAVLRPVWHTSLLLPDPSSSYRIDVQSLSEKTLYPACSVVIGEQIGDPILSGTTRLFSAFAQGGSEIPIWIDCSTFDSQTAIDFAPNSLVNVACYGYVKDPQIQRPWHEESFLEVIIKVHRCPDSCLGLN